MAEILSFAELARGAMHRRLAALTDPNRGSSIDEELAKLIYDSWDDDSPDVVGIRVFDAAWSSSRHLTFEGRGLLIEVQLDGHNRELTCQVVPPQPATMEVRHSEGATDLGQDDFGTFYLGELPAGAVSFCCVPVSGDTPPTATSWLSI